MANIPIRDIPGAVVTSPDPSNLIPMDNGSIMQKTTIENAVNTTLPLSSQAEAEAGVDNAKRMSPLRTKQAIDAQTPTIVNTAITALNLGTMSQEAASDYTPTSGLAAVALSNSYTDLSDLPTLGTAAATDASDYATAAQGSLADSSIQPGDAQLVPSGGTIGQVLVKNSGTNYDTGWVSSAAATAVSYAPQTLTDAQAGQARANIDAGVLAGFRNKIINGDFVVNQRNASAKAQAAGVYGYDRWKGHANGIEQVIEGLPAGTYTLTFGGGGTGSVGGQTPATSPAVFTVATGGNISVVVPATATRVSLVPGDATAEDDPFSPRHIQQEIALCQRYYESSFPNGVSPAANQGTTGSTGYIAAATGPFEVAVRIAPKRVSPTVQTYSPNDSSSNWSTNTDTPTASLAYQSASSFSIRGSNGTTPRGYSIHWTADAEL